MATFFYVSDLHGRPDRIDKLFDRILSERPAGVLVGGDLMAGVVGQFADPQADFIEDCFVPGLSICREKLGDAYPTVCVILGNDDPVDVEESLIAAEHRHLLTYISERCAHIHDVQIFGYPYVPPTPFLLKDWEKYDVSRYVPPACVSPEEGFHTRTVDPGTIKWSTIRSDLEALVHDQPMDRSIVVFHAPPYDTPLDRAALDGKTYEHVPLDVHVGSIAIRRFIEHSQPLLTLHGHVHESSRLTGEWKTRIGQTVCINAAHDGPELALVRFDSERVEEATRSLI